MIAVILLLAASALLNLAAWVCPGFADWYAENLFPLVTAPLARLTSQLPFSMGEWMLIAAVIWALVWGVMAAAALLLCVGRRIRPAKSAESGLEGRAVVGQTGATDPVTAKSTAPEAAGAAEPESAGTAGITVPRLGNTTPGRAGKAPGTAPAAADHGFPGAFRRFSRATFCLIAIVVPVMSLNCFVLYHTTPMEESLAGYGREYTIEELGELRDYIVEKCNTLAEEMPRDENGEVVYAGGTDAMEDTARKAVDSLGERENMPDVLSRLAGWQTTPKTLFFSDFVSQQYIQGYYFPFSMESNYNAIMKIMNKPSTMCHELAHTHGFIYEDEANLIGFLACIYSEDVIFQYSGWLSVLYYVNNSYYANVDEATYRAHPAISDRVRFDNEFLSDEAWTEVEEDAVLSTETVKAATDIYLDTTLKANGVESGKASYTHVVELLLMYYDGNYDGR